MTAAAKKAAPAKRAAKKQAPVQVSVPRVPYEERWQTFTAEQKAKVADDKVEVIDALVDRLCDAENPMTEEELAQLVAADEVALDRLTARMESTRAHLDRLTKERSLLFTRLVLEGVPVTQVGRRAGVTNMVVSFALGISEKVR